MTQIFKCYMNPHIKTHCILHVYVNDSVNCINLSTGIFILSDLLDFLSVRGRRFRDSDRTWFINIINCLPDWKYYFQCLINEALNWVIWNDDDDYWCSTTTFVHVVDSIGRATSRGNEVKSEIYPRRDSNTGRSDMWSNTLPLEHEGALEVGLRSRCISYFSKSFGTSCTLVTLPILYWLERSAGNLHSLGSNPGQARVSGMSFPWLEHLGLVHLGRKAEVHKRQG